MPHLQALFATFARGLAVSYPDFLFQDLIGTALTPNDSSDTKIILTNTDEDNVKIIGSYIKEKSWS